MIPSFLSSTLGRIQIKWLTICLLFTIPLFFISCEKDHLFDFAKRTGKTVSIDRSVDGPFTKIYLNDDVELVITQGPIFNIKLKGGENLLPGIETSIIDSTLTIRNTNAFNWMRSYNDKITAYVTLPHLHELLYKATSTVTNTDTIREDSLTVNSIGGSGYINLTINTGISKLYTTNGSVDMNIKGKSGLNFIYLGAYGSFHCLDLQSPFLYIRNKGTNDCYVSVLYHLEYEINGIGNIYYRGNPPEISGKLTSNGKLIKYE